MVQQKSIGYVRTTSGIHCHIQYRSACRLESHDLSFSQMLPVPWRAIRENKMGKKRDPVKIGRRKPSVTSN
jgi:hypothetical protein